jgi:hypothetical protein
MGSVSTFMVRGLLWTNQERMESVIDEVSRISSTVVTCVSDLRGRAAQLDSASVEVAQARVLLLEPQRERL